MKATLSFAAVILFAALANCVPIPQVDQATSDASDSASGSASDPTTVNNIYTTTSVVSTQITLENGTTVSETCNTTTVVDLNTLDSIITSHCVPDSDAVASGLSTSGNDASTSSGDGSNNQGQGVAIIGRSVLSSQELAAALAQSSGNSDIGVGASIISRGTISKDQVGQLGAGVATQPSLLRRRGVVSMSSNVETPEGSVVENCRINVTPDATGQFTESQDCELSLQPNISNTNGGDNGAASSPVESSSVAATPSIIPSISSSSSSVNVPPAVTPTAAPPALAPPASPSTSVPVSSSPSPVSDSSSGSAGAIIIGTGVTSMDLPSVSPTVSPISAAEDNTTPAFTMPGRQISILPVGLAIFAGVSVIALIVVGVVTYERTKYRKNFRSRKLAEQMKSKADMLSERSMV